MATDGGVWGGHPGYRVNFDLHRAGGLWVWPMLFVFAWSSVMFNLNDVYKWVSSRLFDFKATAVTYDGTSITLKADPRLDYRAAQAVGEKLMAEQATLHGFTIEQPMLLSRDGSSYYYYVKSSSDIRYVGGVTYVQFDADSGALRNLYLPQKDPSGDVVTDWLDALHMANFFGLPYRIFVCVLGLLITMLSVTGVYLWWKKRKARLRRPRQLRSVVYSHP